MPRYLRASGWILIFAAAAAALDVEGNTAFTAAEINMAAFSSGAVDPGAVERLYLRAGYLDVAVTLAGGETAPTRLTVAEGPAYKLGKISIVNNSPLDRAALGRYLPFETGAPPSPLDIRAGLNSLLADLAARGYIRAQASWELRAVGGDRAALDITISAGRRYAAGEIALPGISPQDDAALRARLDTRPGKTLGERKLAGDLLAVIDYYRERGYPRAAARPGGFRLADEYKEIDFLIAVTPGEQVVLRTVTIKGNRRTRDAVIRRELTLRPGEPYDLRRVRASARRVYALGYFEEEPGIRLDDEEAGALVVAVREGRTYRAGGALAYEPGEDDDGSLIGELGVDVGNLAGTGRDLRADYRRLASGLTDASLSYYEPWIGGIDLFAQPQGEFRERTTYRKIESELTLGTHPGTDLTIAAGGGYDRVWRAGASRKLKALGWARYDGRDYFPNPRRGWYGYTRWELGVKTYDADGFRERIPKGEVDAWVFAATARAQVLAARLRLQGFLATRVAEDEFYPLGGRADLRGFREEQFLTDRQALATVEYRFLTGRDNRLFLFADGAYRHRGDLPGAGEGVEAAYGAGFRARTPVGLYGVDYGLALGAGPLEGMLHVSMEQEF